MKKIMTGILVAALLATFGTAGAFAANEQAIVRQSYVDADGDGVCDNRGTGGNGQGYVDADGDGVCDNRGAGGNGQGYVDADGDGVCDNRGTGGIGRGYVDADGDGVCDNKGGRMRMQKNI